MRQDKHLHMHRHAEGAGKVTRLPANFHPDATDVQRREAARGAAAAGGRGRGDGGAGEAQAVRAVDDEVWY